MIKIILTSLIIISGLTVGASAAATPVPAITKPIETTKTVKEVTKPEPIKTESKTKTSANTSKTPGQSIASCKAYVNKNAKYYTTRKDNLGKTKAALVLNAKIAKRLADKTKPAPTLIKAKADIDAKIVAIKAQYDARIGLTQKINCSTQETRNAAKAAIKTQNLKIKTLRAELNTLNKAAYTALKV